MLDGVQQVVKRKLRRELWRGAEQGRPRDYPGFGAAKAVLLRRAYDLAPCIVCEVIFKFWSTEGRGFLIDDDHAGLTCNRCMGLYERYSRN